MTVKLSPIPGVSEAEAEKAHELSCKVSEEVFRHIQRRITRAGITHAQLTLITSCFIIHDVVRAMDACCIGDRGDDEIGYCSACLVDTLSEPDEPERTLHS
jgi:hypothetical protein